MAVMDINVFSVMLRHGMDVTVVLPDDIDDEEQLKCVWLYHGGSGDNTEWLYHTALVDTVEKDILQQFFRMLMSPALLI